MAELIVKAGQIVIADWRGNALPNEPNKLRPAVVVEDDGLFARDLPTLTLVPLSSDPSLVIEEVVVSIPPTAENGCARQCWAMSYLITTTAKARIRPTMSHITQGQLDAIRRQVATAIGVG